MISSGRAKVSRLGVTNTAVPARRTTLRTSASTRSGSGTCSIDWTESTRVVVIVRKRQLPHVRDVGLALLTGERLWVDVHADRLPRREQVIAVSDPAAEI